MATQTQTPDTPAQETPMTFSAVPDDIAAIAIKRPRKVDDAMADALFAIASKAKQGASNNRDYPSTDDKAYKSDARKMKAALMARLNAETQRAVVIPFKGTGESFRFAVAIRERKPRKPRSPKS